VTTYVVQCAYEDSTVLEMERRFRDFQKLRDDIVELFPRAESWSFPPKKYVGKMKEPGEHDRLLTTFLAGLRCSERDRLLTTFLAGLRFHSDGAVLQWSPSGGRRWRSGATL